MGNAQPGGYYFAPPSHWPIVGSIALFLMAIGGVLLMNGYGAGWIPFGLGIFDRSSTCSSAGSAR